MELYKYQTQSKGAILSFYTFNVSNLCILHPWRWPRGRLTHVRVHCVYKPILIYLRAFVGTIIVYMVMNLPVTYKVVTSWAAHWTSASDGALRPTQSVSQSVMDCGLFGTIKQDFSVYSHYKYESTKQGNVKTRIFNCACTHTLCLIILPLITLL
jgi:hypothetical protein